MTQLDLSEPSLSPRRALSTITANPAPGLVKSIGEICVTFVGVDVLELTDNGQMPRLLKENDDILECSTVKAKDNTLLITFSPEVTEEGTYILNIPRKSIRVDNTTLKSDVSFTYTIGSNGETGILYEAPSGTIVNCQSDFLSYFVADGGLSGMPLCGKPLHYVLGDDGNLYLYNILTVQPYGGCQTSSYIKGTPSGDNKWKFSFPQPIYETAENGKPVVWDLNYLQNYVDESTNASTYRIYEENNSVEFTIDENGNVVWVNSNEDDGFAIGATRSNGSWTGFANVIRSTYLKFTEIAPEIDPKEYEIWKLTTGPNDNRISRNVDVYIENNDMWIRGLSKNYLPKAWAHATINGKKATFDPYIGECDAIGQYLFLYGYIDSHKTDLVFKYYAEEKGMTYNGEYIINPNEQFYYAVESYEYPTLEYVATAGIDNITEDNVVKTEWFTLDGIQVSEPSEGFYICRRTYASNRVECTKVIR